MMHPILQTLARVRNHLRHNPSEQARLAKAVGLRSPRALRHADRDGWEPKPTTLAALDQVIPDAVMPPHNKDIRTTVPSGKAQNSAAAQQSVAPLREMK